MGTSIFSTHLKRPTHAEHIAFYTWLGVCLIVLTSLLMPSVAHAVDLFTPVPGDRSISQLLQPAFGTLFGGSNTVLADAVKVLNGACLLLGTFLAAYVLVFGSLQTAHEGKLFGRWNSMYLPLRTALGIGLICPMPSGYNVAQELTGYLVKQGVYLASNTWAEASKSLLKKENLVSSTMNPDVGQFANELMKVAVCVNQGNKLVSENPVIYKGPYAMYDDPSDKTRLRFGDKGLGNSDCGSVQFQEASKGSPVDGSLFTTGANRNDAIFNDLLRLPKAQQDAANNALATAHRSATKAMYDSLLTASKPFAEKSATQEFDASSVPGDSLTRGVILYQSAVADAARKATASEESFAELTARAKSDGWLLAGSWFMRMTAIQDYVTKATQRVPNIVPPMNLSNYNQEGIDGQIEVSASDFALAYSRYDRWKAYSQTTYGADKTKDVDAANAPIGAWLKDFLPSSDKYLGGFGLTFAYDGNTHPMLAIKDYGDRLMIVSEVMIGISVGSKFLATFPKLGWVATAAALIPEGIRTFLGTVGWPLLIFGAFLSIVVPMLPFLIFIMSAFGWLLLVAEAIVAVPLTCLLMLTPSGDDIVGGSKQGWLLVFAVMMKPTLIVLGFICACLIIEPVLKLFLAAFWPILMSNQAGTITGIGTIIFANFVFMGTTIFIVFNVFRFTFQLPDQVMRLMGANSGGLSGFGNVSDSAKMAMTQAAGQMSSVGQQATKSIGDSIEKSKQDGSASTRMMGGADKVMEDRKSAIEGSKLSPERQADLMSKYVNPGRDGSQNSTLTKSGEQSFQQDLAKNIGAQRTAQETASGIQSGFSSLESKINTKKNDTPSPPSDEIRDPKD